MMHELKELVTLDCEIEEARIALAAREIELRRRVVEWAMKCAPHAVKVDMRVLHRMCQRA